MLEEQRPDRTLSDLLNESNLLLFQMEQLQENLGEIDKQIEAIKLQNRPNPDQVCLPPSESE